MSDFKQRLLANQQRLTHQLNVEKILSKLYVDRALSKHEYEELKSTISSHGMIKAAHELVLLLTKKDVSAYENFMSSLRNTGQTALAHALEESASISLGSKLSKRDLETLRGNMEIDIKEYTNYDLWISLRNQRGQIDKSPFELSDDDGVPLTHMCVDRGRLSLLSVFLHMGWWTMLTREKVPSSSASIFKGMNCLDVAEAKRSRKPVDEVKMYTEWEESLSSIMKCARSGDYTRVATLVANEGESIHYRDTNNANALYWGVVSGDVKIFKELLNKGGLDPTMRTRKNETLLHIACMLGMAEFIPELVKCNIDVNVKDTNGKTALDRVAENGDIDTLKAFMSVNIRPKSSFPVIAAFSDRKNFLEHCLDTKLHEINSKDQYNRTPIMRAVEGNRSEIVQYLLAKGAQLDLLPTTNKNLLHIVAESGSAAIFNMLMPALRKPGLFDKFLKQRDRYNGVELCFLIRGRDKGRDAWHYVEVSRHRVPLFLKKTKSGNVDVAAFGTDVKSGWGINPEQETIYYIEELFKKRRLDTTAPADSTPLHIAIFKGNTDVAKLLLQHGADVNIKDKFGLTPLMLAAAKDNLELIQELERYGAKFSDVNVDGKNAAEVAYENENDTIINYIGGRDHYRLTEEFITSDVTRLKYDLSPEKLEELRCQGRNVRQYIIDTLRDFKIDINQALLDLGSGPILEQQTNFRVPTSQQRLSDAPSSTRPGSVSDDDARTTNRTTHNEEGSEHSIDTGFHHRHCDNTDRPLHSTPTVVDERLNLPHSHAEEHSIEQDNNAMLPRSEQCTEQSVLPQSQLDREYYGFKDRNNAPCGNALCVIVRNFRKDMGGFYSDEKRIIKFFRGKLGCEIMIDYDLTFVGLNKFLDKCVVKLRTGAYDRLYVFILSHGADKYISVHSENGQPSDYEVQELFSRFSDSNVPEMKGFPRCFFIASCRERASVPSVEHSRPNEFYPQADFAVCFACPIGQSSWVMNGGSIFIQQVLNVFETYYRRECFNTMFTRIRSLVKQVSHHILEKENKVQTIFYMWNLTKKLFLYVEDDKTSSS